MVIEISVNRLFLLTFILLSENVQALNGSKCSDDFRASLGKIVCAVSYFQNLLGTVFQCIIKLAISKCYGKVRVLFFRATTLVSTRKSHSSGVRGLVVRCLLFNPQGSCSNSGVWANFFYKYSDAEGCHFFGTMRLLLFFGFVRLFSKILYCSQRVLPSVCFDILQQNEC